MYIFSTYFPPLFFLFFNRMYRGILLEWHLYKIKHACDTFVKSNNFVSVFICTVCINKNAPRKMNMRAGGESYLVASAGNCVRLTHVAPMTKLLYQSQKPIEEKH